MTASSRCVLDPLSCYYMPNTCKGCQHRFCSRRSPAGGCVHRCHPIHTAPLVPQGFFRFPSRRASCSRAEGPIPWFPGGHGAHTYGKKVCAGSGTNAGMCCTRSLVSRASLCIHGPFSSDMPMPLRKPIHSITGQSISCSRTSTNSSTSSDDS